jgi:ABC-type transporter Mla MlaB component
MDLAKFLDLIQKNELFFSKVSRLGDPFEGSFSRGNLVIREYIIEHRHTDPDLDTYKDMDEATLRSMWASLSNFVKESAETTYVSCWHMNEYESAAMWNLYSKSSESVCIQTDFVTLEDALPDQVFIGMVRYVNYETDIIPEQNLFFPIMHKRLSFMHEQEVRAVTVAQHADSIGSLRSGGMSIPLDVNKLIRKIYINPTAPSWFSDVVSAVAERYGLSADVTRSSLSDDPVY